MAEYNAITAVWEITMACNMRCMHCGSSCAQALPDELTTAEALSLCDDIGSLGLKWITLSGGEPLTRKDWPLIAKRLSSNGVIPNMITNGWLIDDNTVVEMKNSGIGTIAISLDGMKETHNKIRKEGSFERNIAAFKLFKKHGQYCGAITSINSVNIGELEDIRKQLVELAVDSWQLQICIPMGNMIDHKDELVKPEDIEKILNFCVEVAKSKDIVVYPADCLGYYSKQEELLRQMTPGQQQSVPWSGCNAGKRGFGILHNGDILGCTSIRDRSLIEGNIKDKNLIEIWKSEDSFKWSRKMGKSDLGGMCKTCLYGDVCLGGCPNTRLTMNGTMKSENPYCVYRVARENIEEKVKGYGENIAGLFEKAKQYAMEKSFQESAIILEYLHKLNEKDDEVLALLGYTHFFMGNYDEAVKANKLILKDNPKHSYANKGLGLSLHKQGKTNKGIEYIKKAINFAPSNFKDPYYDLAFVYTEIGEQQKANEILLQI